MTRTGLALVAAAVLALGGCSSDDATVGSPAPTATTPADTPADTPAPTTGETITGSAPDPVRWDDESGTTCTEVQGPVLLAERFRVSEPVTVARLGLAGARGGIEVGRVTVAAEPRGAVPSTGGWKGTAPRRAEWDRLAWTDRERARGAQLSPGWYHAFLPVTLDGRSRIAGFALTWRGDAGSGTSTGEFDDAFTPSSRGL